MGLFPNHPAPQAHRQLRCPLSLCLTMFPYSSLLKMITLSLLVSAIQLPVPMGNDLMGAFVSQFAVFIYHPWATPARVLVPCVSGTQNVTRHTVVQLIDTL